MSDQIKRLLLQELLRMNNMGADGDGERNDLWPGPFDPYWQAVSNDWLYHLCWDPAAWSFDGEAIALLPQLYREGLVTTERLNQDVRLSQAPGPELEEMSTHKWTVTDAGKAFLAEG